MSAVQDTYTTRVTEISSGQQQIREDQLAIEEPLEIQLQYGAEDNRQKQSISITMRTPGDDADLAAGFLYTEGIVNSSTQIQGFERPLLDQNTILVKLSPATQFDMHQLERHFYTSSSCGVCGKSSIDAVRQKSFPQLSGGLPRVHQDLIPQLPLLLREKQDIFDYTGGLHAAALFHPSGQLQSIKEDVGRHNALDKLIGAALMTSRIPLQEYILLLSGRISFELVQKALMAGIPFITAVGAPSSLAIELAREGGMTVVGFVRQDRFNVYTGPERILHLRPH